MSRERHPRKQIEKAIRYAESHGWTIRKRTGRGHSWGHAYCPTSEHHVAIWSTPKNADNHAKNITRAVDRCDHSKEG